jgi:hypothetical protein
MRLLFGGFSVSIADGFVCGNIWRFPFSFARGFGIINAYIQYIKGGFFT